MTTFIRNLIVPAAFLLLALAAPAASARAQAGQEAQEKGDKKPPEKEKKEKKDDKGFISKTIDKATGNKNASDEEVELEYSKLLEGALRKYNDPKKEDFKNRVDRLYKQKRREHSELAFQMNTFNARDELTTFTGDKVKLEDTLYDNPLVQDYVNRVGHSLVPSDSLHRFAFKVILNPIPDARALSTGTIYVTTGMLSLIDTEAQLAYILGHEIVHVEKKHWLQDALVVAETEEKTRNIAKYAGIATLLGGVVGGVATKSLSSGVGIGALSGLGTYGILKFLAYTKTYDWSRAQENEADQEGLRLMFERNYDPREVPKLYARIRALTDREPRLADGFLAQSDRVVQRLGYFSSAMTGKKTQAAMIRGGSNLRRLRSADAADSATLSPVLEGKAFIINDAEAEKREKDASQRLAKLDELVNAKLDKNEIIAAEPEFNSVMADLRRDNGVRALYYDMFALALENLSEARRIRSNDPYAHYYYAKALQLTARNHAEKADALQAFIAAISDDKRGVLAEPWLYRALALLGDKNSTQGGEIVGYLHKYVEVYQQEHAGTLPPNMDAIYAYLKDLGDHNWVARPATNVSTKNVEPIDISTGARTPQRQPQAEPTPQPKPQPPATTPPPVKGKPQKP